MLDRCENPQSNRFYTHGARGIKVCDRWKEFDNFFADMGAKPEGLTLERVNNDGDYEPSNCRWATYTEQSRNTRRNFYIDFRGERRCLSEWCELLGLPYKRTWEQIRYRNRSLGELVTQ